MSTTTTAVAPVEVLPEYRPHREFEQERWPSTATSCDGMLRVMDRRHGTLVGTRCDRCGFEVEIRLRLDEPTEPEPQQETIPF